jgi:hypothetical protein
MTMRAIRGLCLVLALSLWLTPDAAQAQCKPGDLLVGEDADNYYCRSRGEYQGSAAEKAGMRFCAAKLALAADQKAVRELGFASDVERFEMFERVAREQKSELQRKVFDALLDQGLEAAGLVVDSAKSLNPWNVNNAVNMLNDKGFGNAAVIAALRRVAATKDKPAMAAAYHDFAEAAKAAKEGWSTRQGVATDARNAELRLLVGALKIMQGNPELGLLVTGAELGESLAYLTYVNGQVSDLAQSTDDKLIRIGMLTQRLKGHVDTVRASRWQWRQAMGIGSGEPRCAS